MVKRKTPFQKMLAECRKSIAEWKDVPHVIMIYNCNDQYVCEACRKIEGDHFNIDEVPELPYQNCTSETGCRCWAYWSTALGG